MKTSKGQLQAFAFLWGNTLLVYFVVNVCDTTQTSVWGSQWRLPGGGKVDVNGGVKGVAQTQRQRGSFREVQLAQATQHWGQREDLRAVAGQVFLVCPTKEFPFLRRAWEGTRGFAHRGPYSRMRSGQGLEWRREVVRPWCQSEKGDADSFR